MAYRFFIFIPIVVFFLLVMLFYSQLIGKKKSHDLPSELLHKPAPFTDLPALAGVSSIGLKSYDFKGRITVLNIFASWCAPCRAEHPILMTMANNKKFTLVGLNYKDNPENTKRFLEKLGNPYATIGIDTSGHAGIDWGVYGVPETYVINKSGVIIYKQVGPLSDDILKNNILPAVERAE
jgi:cytochrome c biogenesis protein CcmG, thiol:disulfide interchange protein DsbE